MSMIEKSRPGNPALGLGSAVNPFHRGIGRRLITFILLFSSLVTLVLTATQLYLDFQRDVDVIEKRLIEIEASYLDSIAGSLWNMDIEQIQVQLEGILRLPDMRAVEVRETVPGVDNPLVLFVGEKRDDAALVRSVPIVHRDRSGERAIGVFHVEATLDQVYQRLFDKTLVILVTQGIKTFLVSAFILYIVYRLVTRHIVAVARYLGSYDLREAAPPLVLQRSGEGHGDELDLMAGSINEMAANLESIYEELRATNEELEHDVEARTRAEEEVRRLNEELERRVVERTQALSQEITERRFIEEELRRARDDLERRVDERTASLKQEVETRQRAEANLNRMLSELSRSNAELERFAFVAAHDLQEPVRSVVSFSQLLERRLRDGLDAESAECLDFVVSGAKHMGELVRDLLAFSQLSKTQAPFVRVALTDVLTHARANLRTAIEETRTEVLHDGDLPVVVGSQSELVQVFQNLIANAVKFRHPERTPRIRIHARHEGNLWHIHVRDNGIGIAPEYREQVFEVFKRLHTKKAYPGTGMGLAICRRVAEHHGGRLWLEADVDEGAEFVFSIPAAEGSE